MRLLVHVIILAESNTQYPAIYILLQNSRSDLPAGTFIHASHSEEWFLTCNQPNGPRPVGLCSDLHASSALEPAGGCRLPTRNLNLMS
jgi:hypothetical protein